MFKIERFSKTLQSIWGYVFVLDLAILTKRGISNLKVLYRKILAKSIFISSTSSIT